MEQLSFFEKPKTYYFGRIIRLFNIDTSSVWMSITFENVTPKDG
jgi:hypothetical protein